jgi:prepilin-type N-terminal cleavage/methylation domain-containing protein/prepilin-type processing-associated H-X9-DG protein
LTLIELLVACQPKLPPFAAGSPGVEGPLPAGGCGVSRERRSVRWAFTLIELLVACQPKLPPFAAGSPGVEGPLPAGGCGVSRERRSVRWAFTLIELLVVVAVVSVLAALLAPALQTAREKARVVQCTGHLRQIGIAMRAYSADYGGAAIPDTASAYWQSAVDAYLTTRPAGAAVSVVYSPVWNCPKNPSRQVVSTPRPGWSGGYMAYNINRALYDQNAVLGGIRHAERKVYFAETDWHVWFDAGGGSATVTSYAYIGPNGFYGHFGGMNLLFCDLHVEWVPRSSPILAGTSAASSKYWNPTTD